MGIIKILLMLAVLLLVSCSQEADVKNEIEKANYCNTKDDCVLIGSKCPFGCYIYSNSAEAERVRGLVDSFNSNCVYSCIACEGVECVNGKCEPVCSS